MRGRGRFGKKARSKTMLQKMPAYTLGDAHFSMIPHGNMFLTLCRPDGAEESVTVQLDVTLPDVPDEYTRLLRSALAQAGARHLR